MDTTIRYLEMLEFLPRYYRKKSLFEIRDHLNTCGYRFQTERFKDLKKLETPFGLICDDQASRLDGHLVKLLFVVILLKLMRMAAVNASQRSFT